MLQLHKQEQINMYPHRRVDHVVSSLMLHLLNKMQNKTSSNSSKMSQVLDEGNRHGDDSGAAELYLHLIPEGWGPEPASHRIL